MYLIEGNEVIEELLALTYGLEEANSRYYSMLSDRAATSSVAELFHILSDLEGKHKRRIWEMYEELSAGRTEQTEFENRIVVKTLENGKTPDQMVAQHPGFFDDPPDAVEFSMALETDSLDLYLKMARKVQTGDVSTLFFTLAEEEKKHLEKLSELYREILR